MLKYIKTLRHVSISTDNHQGICLYLVKVTELLFSNYYNSVTLTSYRHIPWWWSVEIETCGSIFIYFNIKIGIL